MDGHGHAIAPLVFEGDLARGHGTQNDAGWASGGRSPPYGSGVGEAVVQRRDREFVEEVAEAGGEEVDELFALFGGAGGGVAGAGVVGQEVPGAGDADPAVVDG